MVVVLNFRIHWEAIGVWRENRSEQRSSKNNKKLVGLLWAWQVAMADAVVLE